MARQKKITINDEDRRQFVKNTEGWYWRYQWSGSGLRRFVKENRDAISRDMREMYNRKPAR